ncbi:glycosyltransferase [Campylobacter sp. RM16187]|uniref:glycosyltransferase n=1 Tax=Campylobacter sp. RM16187 TaxID=1660063 RepID=UPI0021B5DEEB|nr:glycosyltransferase [Campylobacter sp. RM16187]QKG30331.1 putative glycosyltransferase [Campylobacter sp. RM16187]
MDRFYKQFEDEFRGSRNDIKHRLQVYLPFLNFIKDKKNAPKALDMGCGRGEFLEILKENGFFAKGADLSEQMLSECVKKDLEVYNADILDFLKEQDDKSQNLITGFQIAEHLTFEVLQEFFKEAFRVLDDSGLFILETPNPENIRVATLYFYYDVTHIKPIPPELLSFFYKFNGFNSFMIRLNSKKIEEISTSDLITSVGLDYSIIGIKNPKKEDLERLKTISDKISELSFDDIDLKIKEQKQILENRIQDNRNYINDVDNSVKQLENFVHKFKHVFRHPIAVYKFLKKTKDFSKKNLYRILKKIDLFLLNNTTIRAKVKKLVYKFPRLKNRLQSLRNKYNTNSYYIQGGDDEFLPSFFELKPSKEHMANKETKIKKYDKNFSHLNLIGHFDWHYSLASTNRNIAYGYLKLYQDLSIIPFEDKKLNTINNSLTFLDEVDLNIFIFKDSKENSIALYHHYPLIEDINTKYGYPLALFFWEESKIPQKTIDALNNNYKGVIASTWFVKKTLIDNGCYLPIKLSNLPMKLPEIQEKQKKDALIRLLHISSCFPRKGVDVLLRAFNEVCKELDNMLLTIKTFHNPHNNIKELIEKLVDEKHRNKINLILEDYTDKQISKLYEDHDIVVLPSRGEGLNLPAIEAIFYNKPVIATNYSGHCDFLDDRSNLIDFKFAKSQSHINLENSVWVEPSCQDLIKNIKEISNKILNNDETLIKNIKNLREEIVQAFFSEDAIKAFVSSLACLRGFEPKNSDPSIAFISTYNTSCGIAEYTKSIVAELEKLDIKTQIYTWSEQDNFQENIFRIDQNEPLKELKSESNTIWIQHHFAFFSLEKDFIEDLKKIKKDGKNLFITLHSTRPLISDLSIERQKEWQKALSEFDRIFIHGIDDLNVLKSIGLVDNVILIPHGVNQDLSKIQRSKNKEFIVGFFGFMFEHKNLPTLIKAFAEFSKTTNAKLIILSTVLKNRSEAEFKRCLKICNELNLNDKVQWHTEFLDMANINKILSYCDSVVLPYLQSQESASGAARIALSACKNVIVTPATIFNDLKEYCIKAQGFDEKHILSALNLVYENRVAEEIYKARELWIKDNSWTLIVRKYIDIFKSVSINKEFLSAISEK